MDLAEAEDGRGWCCWAISAADAAAALSSAVEGMWPALMESIQNWPLAVLLLDPFNSPSCLCLFFVFEIWTAKSNILFLVA